MMWIYQLFGAPSVSSNEDIDDVGMVYLSDSFDTTVLEIKAAAEHRRITNLLNASIDALHLSIRAYRCLHREYITTVGQLARTTERRILALPDVGPKTVKEIKDKLERYGLSLGMTFEPGLVEPLSHAEVPSIQLDRLKQASIL